MQVFNSTAALDFHMVFDSEETSNGWGDRPLNHETRQNGRYRTTPYSRHSILDLREAGKHHSMTQPKQESVAHLVEVRGTLTWLLHSNMEQLEALVKHLDQVEVFASI